MMITDCLVPEGGLLIRVLLYFKTIIVCLYCYYYRVSSMMYPGYVFQAALIMQVLQLTDQQIAMLPPDQRQSILILKEQISKNAQ